MKSDKSPLGRNKVVYLFVNCILFLMVLSPIDAQVQLLNDEFDNGSTLPNWININEEEGWNITQLESYNIDDSTAGAFYLKPITESWYGEYRGAYLYKYISGDFVLTTEVTATARDGVSLPSSTFSLAGIMVRKPMDYPNQDPSIDWMPNEQNYIFMSLGQATGPGFDFEIKNTCNSNSCIDIVPIDFNTAQIRMARMGNRIIVLSRFPGGQWQVRNRYDRDVLQCSSSTDTCGSPFPDTLQIGFVSYTDWPKISSLNANFQRSTTLHPDSLIANGIADPTPGVPYNPDIIANFDFARFDSLSVPSAFAGLDITNPAEVSDAELLSFLGYDSEPYCPDSFHIFDGISKEVLHVQASQIITADNTISDQAEVIFGAGAEISLMPGFEVGGNSVFQVLLDGCTE